MYQVLKRHTREVTFGRLEELVTNFGHRVNLLLKYIKFSIRLGIRNKIGYKERFPP